MPNCQLPLETVTTCKNFKSRLSAILLKLLNERAKKMRGLRYWEAFRIVAAVLVSGVFKVTRETTNDRLKESTLCSERRSAFGVLSKVRLRSCSVQDETVK